MERLKSIGNAIWDEVTFWGEVVIEFLDLDKNKYHYMIQAHKEDMERELRQMDLELKRDYYKNK